MHIGLFDRAHTHWKWNTIWIEADGAGPFDEKVVIDCSSSLAAHLNSVQLLLFRIIATTKSTIDTHKIPKKTRRQDMQTQTNATYMAHTDQRQRDSTQHFLCRPHTIFSLWPTHARPMMKQSEAKQPTRNKYPPASQWNLCYVYCVCVVASLRFINER